MIISRERIGEKICQIIALYSKPFLHNNSPAIFPNPLQGMLVYMKYTFSFFQTNTKGAEVLYELVREFIGDVKEQVVFDLYSGTGTIAQLSRKSHLNVTNPLKSKPFHTPHFRLLTSTRQSQHARRSCASSEGKCKRKSS